MSLLSFLTLFTLKIPPITSFGDITESISPCGTDEIDHYRWNHDKIYKFNRQKLEIFTRKFMKKRKNIDKHRRLAAQPYHAPKSQHFTIPIVFHVIYNTDRQNVPDKWIYDQINVINNDYRLLNLNRFNTDPDFINLQSNFSISFVLQKIIRKYTTITVFTSGSTDMKYDIKGGSNAWNTLIYYNVWICNIANNVLGFAYIPPITNREIDGATILWSTLPGAGGNYGYGRSLTHEIGHSFGLQHIWGKNGCNYDDGVYDTPQQDTANYGCPNNKPDSCSGQGRDNYNNFMDYTYDTCMTMFTQGQYNRIISLFQPNGFRYEMGQNALKLTINQQLSKPPTSNTISPTTKHPTTIQPTTLKPTTKQPTTQQPTTPHPTTKQPTTKQPTTQQPTTKKPTEIIVNNNCLPLLSVCTTNIDCCSKNCINFFGMRCWN